MKRPLPALRTPIPAPSKSVRQMAGAYEKNNKKMTLLYAMSKSCKLSETVESATIPTVSNVTA